VVCNNLITHICPTHPRVTSRKAPACRAEPRDRFRVLDMLSLTVQTQTLTSESESDQVQVQVCFTSVCGQVQPLDVALSNSV
jgi:hypothetical protein